MSVNQSATNRYLSEFTFGKAGIWIINVENKNLEVKGEISYAIIGIMIVFALLQHFQKFSIIHREKQFMSICPSQNSLYETKTIVSFYCLQPIQSETSSWSTEISTLNFSIDLHNKRIAKGSRNAITRLNKFNKRLARLEEIIKHTRRSSTRGVSLTL